MLIITLVIIITAYFSTIEDKTKPSVERFTEPLPIKMGPSDIETKYRSSTTNASRFCNDTSVLSYGDDFVSANQLLVGGPNPKTYTPPIVAAPSHDLSEWRSSDLTTHSRVNDESNFDASRSGYVGKYYDGGRLDYSGYYGATERANDQCKECYYAPCRCEPRVKSKLETITTQTIQPGVYQRTLLDEPINSNIGISFQKQFDPMLIENSARGVNYTTLLNGSNVSIDSRRRLDPITCCTSPLDVGIDAERRLAALSRTDFVQSESNIFDPRFTGYGSNDRFYIDRLTGQPRYFYDDIDAIKMPNFIARNNVDVFPWATQYGQDVGVEEYGDGYKQLANNAFLQSTLKFRTELQERLMRKRNAELWQRRVAPIY